MSYELQRGLGAGIGGNKYGQTLVDFGDCPRFRVQKAEGKTG